MSTKTSIKRIALVAAAALTLGGFSVITAGSANAATSATLPVYISTADSGTGNGSGVATTMTATAIAGTNNYVRLTVGTTLASGLLGVAVSSTTAAKLSVVTQPSAGTETFTVNADGVSGQSTGTGGSAVLQISTPAVGTITAVVSKIVDNGNGSYTTTTLQTITITVNAASVVGAYSASNSFVVRQDTTTSNVNAFANWDTFTGTGGGNIAKTTADSTAPVSKGSSGSTSGVSILAVRLLDTQATPAAIAHATVSASISGVGLLQGTGIYEDTVTAFQGSAATAVTSSTDVNGYAFIQVKNAGQAGTGVVTVTYTDGNGVSYTVGTKSFVFYGSVASIKAKQGKFVVANSGSATGGTTATTYAVQITGFDSSGNEVSLNGLTILGTSSSVTSIATGNASCASDTVDTSALDCSVTGLSGATAGTAVSVTYSYTDANSVVYKADPIAYVIGGSTINAIAVSFDKASYNIGDLVTMTLTAKDSLGNLIADKQYTVFDTTTSATVFGTSAQLTTAPFGNQFVTFLNGKASTTFYAPYTTGNLVLSATLGGTAGATWNNLSATAAGSTISGTVAITGATNADASLALDAANAATDAANNAYDEAQNATQAAQDALAAVTALAKQVSSLIASVKSLTALVSKIKAKVGA